MNFSFSGGGVVLYSDTPDGVQLLLGQEHEEDGFRDSNLWSAFEGGRKATDKTPLETCIRELHEESLGMFGENCKNICQRNQHMLKIDMRLKDRKRTRQRILYVIKVPYLNYDKIFQERRSSLLRLHEACEQYHSCNIKYILRCGMIVENDEQPRHTIDKIVDVSYEAGRLTVQYECVLGQALLISETTEDIGSKQIESFNEYKNICKLADDIDPQLRAAFSQSRARVNVDFLEKSKIKYFTLRELQNADMLRLIFAPVAKLLCSRLQPANFSPKLRK